MKPPNGPVLAVSTLLVLVGTAFVLVGTPMSAERDPLLPKCPPDQMAAHKAMKNPIEPTAENLAKGKELYEGKALCVACHGAGGKGDGEAGKAMGDPSPRDFTNPKFHKAKSPGEMLCVVKNGSPGTGMVSYVPNVITEEEAWTIINYARLFAGK